MPLDHERLDVYQTALRFHAAAHEIARGIPRGHGDLADQLRRASTSILLNIAEGAGKYSRMDKRRYYSIARGSANECGGLLDALVQSDALDKDRHHANKEQLVKIVQMLVRLIQSMERVG